MPAFTLAYWRELLPHIPLWHALTLPQRQAALALPGSYETPAHAFRNLGAATAAALFETDGRGRTRPAEPLRRLTAAVHRMSGWDRAGKTGTLAYVQASTTLAQRYAMTGLSPGSRPELAAYAFAERMSGGAFGRALLESKTPQEFLRAVGGWIPDGADFGTREFAALRRWMEGAAKTGNAEYILESGPFRGASAKGLSEAELLHLAVGYGLALPFRAADTLLPCFEAFAPASPSGQGPERIEYAPAPGASGPAFARPFLLDDLAAMLRSLRTEPAPLLSDGWSVPAAHLRKMAKGFPALPGFLPERIRDADERARLAFWAVLKLDLARPAGHRGKEGRLALSPQGEAWLGLPRRERLGTLLGWLPLAERAEASDYERLSFLGILDDGDLPSRALSPALPDWLRAAFAGVREPVGYGRLLRSAAHMANPFLLEAERDAALAGAWAAWRTRPQELYRRFLERYAARLAGVGALAFAEGPPGEAAAIAVPTSIGDWLFRRAQTWSLPAPAAQSLVVGADFSVAFLLPDAEGRMEIGAFAEPEGAGLRITRGSVQRGAQAGLQAGDMLESLRARSKHALPGNVVHEIGAWAGSRKTVRLAEAVLIEGDDPAVLAEIRSEFPGEFVPLSPLALKYAGRGTRTTLARRLAKKGFFP